MLYIRGDFYTVLYNKRLRTTPKNLWANLSSDGEVIITNKGKTRAILLDISSENFEETLKAIRQAKAMIVFSNMRSKSICLLLQLRQHIRYTN